MDFLVTVDTGMKPIPTDDDSRSRLHFELWNVEFENGNFRMPKTEIFECQKRHCSRECVPYCRRFVPLCNGKLYSCHVINRGWLWSYLITRKYFYNKEFDVPIIE